MRIRQTGGCKRRHFPDGLGTTVGSVVTTGIECYRNRLIRGIRNAQREVHIAVVVCVIQAAGIEGVIAAHADLIPVPGDLKGEWQTSGVNAELGQVFLPRLVVCPGRVVGAVQPCLHRGRGEHSGSKRAARCNYYEQHEPQR